MTGRPLNVPQGPGGGVKGHTPIKSNSNQPPCSEDQISDILCSSVTMETTPRPHVSEGQGGDGGRPLRQPSPPKLRPKRPGGGLLGPAGSPSGGHATAPQRTTLAGRDKKEKNAPGTPGEDVSTAGEPEELSQSGVERGGGGAWLSPSPRWAERLVWESDNPRRWLLWRRVNAGCELRRGASHRDACPRCKSVLVLPDVLLSAAIHLPGESESPLSASEAGGRPICGVRLVSMTTRAELPD